MPVPLISLIRNIDIDYFITNTYVNRYIKYTNTNLYMYTYLE